MRGTHHKLLADFNPAEVHPVGYRLSFARLPSDSPATHVFISEVRFGTLIGKKISFGLAISFFLIVRAAMSSTKRLKATYMVANPRI